MYLGFGLGCLAGFRFSALGKVAEEEFMGFA